MALALLVTLVVPEIHATAPFLFFFLAIILAATYAGFGPSLLAAGLAGLAVALWIFPPGSFAHSPGWYVVLLAVFFAVAAAMASMVDALRRAQARLYAERETLREALAEVSASEQRLRTALAAVAASEERFRVAQELSLDAFAILEAIRGQSGEIEDFRVQYANPKAAQIVNAARTPLVGQQLLAVLPGTKSQNDLFDRFVQVAESGCPHEIELVYDADGIQGWFRNMTVKLGDGVAVSFFDITERKRNEEQLSYQAFLLDTISDAVYAVDKELRVTLWNRGAERLYGWTAAEAMGKPVTDLLQTDSTPQVAQARIAAIDARTRSHFEAIHHNRAGGVLYIDATASAICNDGGETTGYVVVNRDMTARKRHEQELEELNASLEQRVRERTTELERSNRELDQFAYVASHDLKAPLRAISLLAEWITKDASPVLSPESLEHLAKLNNRVRRMENLLNDLLDYSRAGRIRQAPEEVDTRRLIRSVADLLNLPSTFRVLMPEPLPVLHTERVPLETVLRNLLHNAYKHHHRPEHGIVTITAATLEEEDGTFAAVQFYVADNGPGIAPEYHERIFKLFQTLKPRDEVEGSGMGLSVVKKTIESRGGTIHLDSAPGAGTTFIFTWPLQ